MIAALFKARGNAPVGRSFWGPWECWAALVCAFVYAFGDDRVAEGLRRSRDESIWLLWGFVAVFADPVGLVPTGLRHVSIPVLAVRYGLLGFGAGLAASGFRQGRLGARILAALALLYLLYAVVSWGLLLGRVLLR